MIVVGYLCRPHLNIVPHARRRVNVSPVKPLTSTSSGAVMPLGVRIHERCDDVVA